MEFIVKKIAIAPGWTAKKKFKLIIPLLSVGHPVSRYHFTFHHNAFIVIWDINSRFRTLSDIFRGMLIHICGLFESSASSQRNFRFNELQNGNWPPVFRCFHGCRLNFIKLFYLRPIQTSESELCPHNIAGIAMKYRICSWDMNIHALPTHTDWYFSRTAPTSALRVWARAKLFLRYAAAIRHKI